MRISLTNLSLSTQDAVGQCMLNQIRFFRRRDDDVHAYVVFPPQDVPEEFTTAIHVVSLADLIARRDEHFACSDIYVFHYPGRYPLMESIKGVERGAVIFYYHNVTPPELWGTGADRDELRKGQQGVGELASYADLVVTDSPFNADQLGEEYGCERDRIRVLPLAVPLDRFSPGSPAADLLRQYGLEGRRVILFVGRMAGNKRVDLLVEALPIVQRRVPGASLMLVGDCDSNAAIRAAVARTRSRAAELGVMDDVILTGRVDDLPAYYRMASVYATASLHEGFGVPLIEAMASGVPVVASRTTAQPWVVGDAGLLAEPGDAADLAGKITRVLTEDALRGELVQRGLSRAREFSLARYEAGWASVVSEVTAWLPYQSYPRLRSLPARQATGDMPLDWSIPPDTSVPTIKDLICRGELERLAQNADVMLRDYVVRSSVPAVGSLVAWVRRNLTSHLREPYVDPTFERQVAFNRQMIKIVQQIADHLAARLEAMEATQRQAIQERQEIESRLGRVEAWLGLTSAQMSLLMDDVPPDDPQLANIGRRIEALRADTETASLRADCATPSDEDE